MIPCIRTTNLLKGEEENDNSPFKIKQNKQSSPVKIDSSYHKTLKIYAANTERNIKSVVDEALKEYIDKYNLDQY